MCINDFEASHELAQNCELKRFQGHLYQKGSASEPKNTVKSLLASEIIGGRNISVSGLMSSVRQSIVFCKDPEYKVAIMKQFMSKEAEK